MSKLSKVSLGRFSPLITGPQSLVPWSWLPEILMNFLRRFLLSGRNNGRAFGRNFCFALVHSLGEVSTVEPSTFSVLPQLLPKMLLVKQQRSRCEWNRY